nr:MAG TPA_asm: hypothetical protein [Caudoviricetes sp.]
MKFFLFVVSVVVVCYVSVVACCECSCRFLFHL